MLDLGCPDLASDPASIRVAKNEIVTVEFASVAGSLASAVGLNRFESGDALVTGSTGDRWCVSRDRFDAKYSPCQGTLPGHAGCYRNIPLPVVAKRIGEPFRIARCEGGDVLTGSGGDWAVEYAPGDCGLVDAERFARVYRRL